MVTVPLLVADSGLKGSNLPPSGFSESASGFLSGGPPPPGGAARDAAAIVSRAAAATGRNLNRFIMASLLKLTIGAVPRGPLERASARNPLAGSYRARDRLRIDRCSRGGTERPIPRRAGA